MNFNLKLKKIRTFRKTIQALNVNPYALYDTADRNTSVYYHDNDSWPAHAPVCMWFDYGVLNDLLKEWVVRMDELKSGVITRDEYFEWKINWPYTCDDCGKYEPKKQWRKNF